jgi:5-methylcytosine-specific restriction enzyme A
MSNTAVPSEPEDIADENAADAVASASSPACLRGGLLRRERDQRRGSRDERGYNWVWRRFRLVFLSGHPLCVDCEAAGRITVASEVHHVIKLLDAPDRRLDPTN